MDPTSDDEQTWILLRERSLQPGGFGADRARIWPALLGAQPLSDPPPYSEVDGTDECVDSMDEGMNVSVADPHTDERQIKLDTDRSFVLYPEESGTALARDALQSDLHGLLVSLFRKRRSLHYFQGFHDIMTVVFLTLPRPLHLACAEKMALHRVRDAMGVGLEPVLGLLRVLRNLLRLADPAYAKLLESVSPLPYHALSHLLTLFSHDVPTLPLIQHAWDFLLSREPIVVVWLTAALILHRKSSVYLLAEQDEEGMIHSLLGGIPELVDSELETYDRSNSALIQGIVPDVEQAAAGPQEPTSEVIDGMLGSSKIGKQMHVSGDTVTGDEDGYDRNSIASDRARDGDTIRGRSSSPSTEPIWPLGATDQTSVCDPHSSTVEPAAPIPLPDSRPASPSTVRSSMTLHQEARSVDHHGSLSSTFDVELPHSRSPSDRSHPSPLMQSLPVADGPIPHLDKSAASKSRVKSAPLALTHLLRQADDLLAAYPPSHPSLHVTEIMGPDSVVRTWRPLPISAETRGARPEKRLYDESDDYLETLVNSSRIVIPSLPPSPSFSPRLSKKTRVSPRALGKSLLDPRKIGLRLGALTPAERRVLFIGALLVVGAAVALRSSKSPCVDGIVKGNGGDGLKRLWNDKWTLLSSVVAAWGRGLP